MTHSILRDCAVCGKPVMSKPYQAESARTCSPMCAQALAVREHPDIKPKPDIVAATEPKPSAVETGREIRRRILRALQEGPRTVDELRNDTKGSESIADVIQELLRDQAIRVDDSGRGLCLVERTNHG
jgi:hypothetical protein